jgi:hypothetical protein
VTPFLSQFAVRWDVPLSVYQVDVLELRKGTYQITHRNPFVDVTVAGNLQISASPELRIYSSVYREALTTNSVTYEFLCLYRIVESIPRRRKRLERDAKRDGRTYLAPFEVYPSTKEQALVMLASIYPATPRDRWDDMSVASVLVSAACGKPFLQIVDELAPIRDNIAHTLLQRADELVSLDDPLAIWKVEKWLPVVKCMARVMLKSDFPAELS